MAVCVDTLIYKKKNITPSKKNFVTFNNYRYLLFCIKLKKCRLSNTNHEIPHRLGNASFKYQFLNIKYNLYFFFNNTQNNYGWNTFFFC